MAKLQLTTKHMQVDRAKAIMLALVAATSIVAVFALVASKTYYVKITYQTRVTQAKKDALNKLKANEEAAQKLVVSYKAFASKSPNYLGGTPAGIGIKDGDNARLVLDALPSKYDFPALTASLEKLLTGYTISNIAGSDDVAAQDQAIENPQPVGIPFSFGVATNYKGIQDLVSTFEHSIRPFQIATLDMTGTNESLQVSITASTFFQPARSFSLTKRVIK